MDFEIESLKLKILIPSSLFLLYSVFSYLSNHYSSLIQIIENIIVKKENQTINNSKQSRVSIESGLYNGNLISDYSLINLSYLSVFTNFKNIQSTVKVEKFINCRESYEQLNFLSKFIVYLYNLVRDRNDYSIITYSDSFLFKNDYITILKTSKNTNTSSFNNFNKLEKADVLCQGNIAETVKSLSCNHYFYSVGKKLFGTMTVIFTLKLLLNSKNLFFKKNNPLKLADTKLKQMFLCHNCKINVKTIISLKCNHFVLCEECFCKLNRICVLCSNKCYDILKIKY